MMLAQVIDLPRVTVPKNRIRKEFPTEYIEALAISIKSKGLLHAIVLQDDRTTLVAGECRLRAITRLTRRGFPVKYNSAEVPVGQIPYVTVSDLSLLELKELELEENVRRQDLTIQEKAVAVARLHKIKTDQFGESHLDAGGSLSTLLKLDPLDSDGWSEADTMELVTGSRKGSTNLIRASIAIAENLDDEAVAGARTMKDATKAVRKRLDRDRASTLAKKFNAADFGYDLRNEDFRSPKVQVPSGSIDCIIADPPYGIDAQDHKNFETGEKHEYDDTFEVFTELIPEFAEESYRVAAEEAHAYVFHDYRNALFLKTEMQAAGWDVWPWPLIWVKGHSMAVEYKYGPARAYELILFAVKGKKEVLLVKSDVLIYTHEKGRIHMAQKPMDLYLDLLRRSCYPGDTIYDPFSGSGTASIAAKKLNLSCIAFERETKAYERALQRIQDGL